MRSLKLPRSEPKDPALGAAFRRAVALAERFADAAHVLADAPPFPTPADGATIERDHASSDPAVQWKAEMAAEARENARNVRWPTDEEREEVRREVDQAWANVARTTMEKIIETRIVDEVRRSGAGTSIDRALQRLREDHPREAARLDRDTFRQAVSAVGTDAMWDWIAQLAEQAVPQGDDADAVVRRGRAIARRHQPSRRK